MTIDWAFISELEGTTGTAYVPMFGHSGVTVASGIDLGQLSANDIRALPISTALKNCLTMYAGLQGADARRRLAAFPLRLTDEEVLTLDAIFQGRIVARLRDCYNAVSLFAGGPAFDAIPDAAQTVLASLAFQYGDLAHKCPKAWRYAVCQGWPELIGELRDFGDAYRTRREKEAAYLEAHLPPEAVIDPKVA